MNPQGLNRHRGRLEGGRGARTEFGTIPSLGENRTKSQEGAINKQSRGKFKEGWCSGSQEKKGL